MSGYLNRPPSGLAELQRRFQAYLLNPHSIPPAVFRDDGRASGAQRAEVYAEAYRLRLIEALAADYPALRALLGEDDFAALGRVYAEVHPSRHASIRWFGRHLHRFLQDDAKYRERPELAELAAFEWALSEAFDAAEAPIVSPKALAALPAARWPDLRLRFHPAVRRVELRFNIPEIWRALNQKASLPPFEVLDSPQAWIVWRSDLKLFFRSLNLGEALAFDALHQGLYFAEVCEGLCDRLQAENVAATAAGFLDRWLAEGWIAALETGPEPSGTERKPASRKSRR
jgi:hypothetical protein